MNDTISNIKEFIANNSELSYEEVSDVVDKYFNIIKEEVEYEEDIYFYSLKDNDQSE